MKKLFVSDLDGTLLKIGNEYSAGVSEENRKIIQKYIANGNLFAIASARGHQYLPVISEMLGFTPDYIGGNGTVLVSDGQMLMFYLEDDFYSLLKQTVIEDSLSATVILHTEKASYCESRDAYPFGFENHSGKTYLGETLKPLGVVQKGYGNNGEDGFEGAIYKNTYCTYSHGPVLPKNPKFADLLTKSALDKKYGNVELLELDDTFENSAHKYVLENYIKN